VLPELVHRVDPEYPRSSFARGIEDTLPVLVLVCRSGIVLDAYVTPSYLLGTRDEQPIERDPMLVKAALEAARQYVFKPAMAAGQPIAVWVHVPVAFRR
jgi:TonB family protein